MQKFIPAFAAAMFATTAYAQTTPAPSTTIPEKAQSAATAPSSSMTGSQLMLTDGEAKAWINKKVMSSDGKNLGEVAAFSRDASGHVNEMHADIGGFLGIGETRVRLMPSQFKLQNDTVVVDMTADEAKALPKAAK